MMSTSASIVSSNASQDEAGLNNQTVTNAGPAHASLYGSYEFVGRRYADAGNNTALPAYGTFGAGLTLRTDTISGQGTADAVYGSPIFGRNFRVILSKSW